MYISRVVIRNFRNLREVDLRFRRGLTLLVGENGSGKTNVLHGIRLALDANWGKNARMLEPEDFYRQSGPHNATQILVSVEFDGFDPDDDLQVTLQGALQHDQTVARVTYRFRPDVEARNSILNDGRDPATLSIKDYTFDWVRGGQKDPMEIEWHEAYGALFEGQPLRNYDVVQVPAIRDVVEDLSRYRASPLGRLLDDIEFTPETRDGLIAALQTANDEIAQKTQFQELASKIENSYRHLAGNLNDLEVSLGFSKPTLSSILRNLDVLVADEVSVESFDLQRNGLGFNNLLYIAMLMRWFQQRRDKHEGPQLLLFEEPEAHLHPQAHEILTNVLRDGNEQTILTTHSSNIVVAAGLESLVCLQRGADIRVRRPDSDAGLTANEIADLGRYLEVNLAGLLFAKAVILVEGPAEQLLIAEYARSMGRDLTRFAVQVVAVNGTHFDVYEKLLGKNSLDRRYIIVADGDNFRDADGRPMAIYDDGTNQSQEVDRFITHTTLEYAIAQTDSLEALAAVAASFNRKALADALKPALTSTQPSNDVMANVQLAVLKAAISTGKARFAQAFARAIRKFDVQPPPYIRDAIVAVTRVE